MEKSSDEVILAQEQGVVKRGMGALKELEAEFDMGGEAEGTLVLTSRRLLFITSNEKEEKMPLGVFRNLGIRFSDVEDLESIPADDRNTFISLSSISSVVGKKGELRPKLEVKWAEGAEEKNAVFTELLTGKREKNINDWAGVIEKLKRGEQKISPVPKSPPVDTLEGKIMLVLADMQEKGMFAIQGAVEDQFKVKADPDDVEAACNKLVSQGALVKEDDAEGETYYRMRSPLGEDDLSG